MALVPRQKTFDLLRPFDDDNAVPVKVLLIAEVLEIDRTGQTVDIEVVERDIPRVFVDERERGARHGIIRRNAQPPGDPLGDAGLARPQFPHEGDDVPRGKASAENLPEAKGVLGGVRQDLQGPGTFPHEGVPYMSFR